MKRLAFYLLVLLINQPLFCQNETSQWYFGNKAALDFRSSPPSIVANSVIFSNHGSSGAADKDGNLLFYSDGDTIWDKTHQVMANGSAISNSLTGHGPCLTVKQPGNNSVYFVFTTVVTSTAHYGLTYAVVDLSLAGGNGSVTAKAVPVFSAVCSEVVATRHCNGQDIWVAFAEKFTSNFRAYLVTAAGISSTPVLSPVLQTVNYYHHYVPARFSPSGRKLAVSTPTGTAPSPATNFMTNLLDFDIFTGVFSNLTTIKNSSFLDPPLYFEFSSDGTKLYGTFGGKYFSQWDLCAGTGSAIAASVYTVPGIPGSGHTNIQRAPDGKIYLTSHIWYPLSVIASPNLAGAGCNYLQHAQSVGSGTVTNSLPRFVSSDVKEYFSYKQDLGCKTTSFTAPSFVASASSGCSGITYSITSLSWNFDDAASGPLNVSSLQNPVHTFPADGSYKVKLVVNYLNCAPDTISRTVMVVTPTLTAKSPSVTCSPALSATALISPQHLQGPFSFTWLPGGQTFSVANNLLPGTYTVQAKTLGGSCVFSSTINLPASQLITASVSNTASCKTATAQVIMNGGSGNYTYSWSPAALTTSLVTNLAPGNYTLRVSDQTYSCNVQQTIQINALPNPTLQVSGNLTVCAGQTASITVSGADSYTWTNSNSNQSSFTVAPVSNISYTVNGTNTTSGCTSAKTITVVASDCSSLKKIPTEKFFNVYPNPAGREFIVETSLPADLYIHSLDGRLLLYENIPGGDAKLLQHGLPGGVYLLTFRSAANSVTKKLFITD